MTVLFTLYRQAIREIPSMKLTNIQIQKAKPQEKPYKLSDGGGLYLLVNTSGKYWRLDYRFNDKRRTASLGVYPKVALKRARVLRDEMKEQLNQGVDPGRYKNEIKRKQKLAEMHSFERVAVRWMENYSESWSKSHSERITKSFETRIFPLIGYLPIEQVTPQDLLEVLRKMEREGLGESVRRLKQNIERVFAFAIIEGLLTHNPAQNLEKALKPLPKVQHQKYFREDELPEFLTKLELYNGGLPTKLAIQFAMLTLARSSEIRNAAWIEIDWEKRQWVIPAERMKMDEEHIIPLSSQAIDVLKEAKKINRLGGYIFEGGNARKPISENTMIYAMYRMGYNGRATIHGFRSTASTILNENGFRADVIERLLAHGEKNKIRAAYNHAQYMPERKEALQWYADKLDLLRRPPTKLVLIK